MATSSTTFGELLEPGLKTIFGDAYAQYSPEYTQIFDVQGSTKSFEEVMGLKTFGLLPEKPKGGSVTFEDPAQGFLNRFDNITYGLGFIVERELFDDDLYGVIKRMPKALARSVNFTVETISANILNNGFDSSFTYGDGKELLATDHPRKDGGTFRNELTTAADLDIVSYEQALIDIADYRDEAGKLIQAKAKKLLVAPAGAFQGLQIIKSQKLPATADNDINPAMGTADVMVGHYLTDADAWYIRTDVEGLDCFWRRKPEFTRDNDFDTDNAKFKVTYRKSVGASDPRAIFGSPGS